MHNRCLFSYLKGVKYAKGDKIKVSQSLNEKFMSDEELIQKTAKALLKYRLHGGLKNSMPY